MGQISDDWDHGDADRGLQDHLFAVTETTNEFHLNPTRQVFYSRIGSVRHRSCTNTLIVIVIVTTDVFVVIGPAAPLTRSTIEIAFDIIRLKITIIIIIITIMTPEVTGIEAADVTVARNTLMLSIYKASPMKRCPEKNNDVCCYCNEIQIGYRYLILFFLWVMPE